ncbi:MAG: 4-hydroxybutyrate--acetyl-CoA CoA transferase [Firmicutes bacterium]|nr:4-hydroxybutyrate--acetyl-CoA CoA transferase [Dethiobacter sp.]MBS3889654.1 4-hydroxybutyrate--acetyl-CoA CoA transferase [Bacillota bacterium]
MYSYSSKVVTVSQALGLVKSGDVIVTGLAAAEARAFLAELHTIASRVSQVNVTTCLPMLSAEYFMNPAYTDTFRMAGWFFTGAMRKMHAHGHISFIPNHLHLASSKRLAHVGPQIFVGTGTRPDKHGYISLSLSNVYEKAMLAAADLVIIEVNPKLPRTFGDCEVHVDDVDYFIEVDYDIPELPETPPSDKDLAIGQYIAAMVNDGDCLQLGIGGIPNAVAASLLAKKHLGIHTEMLTTGLMRLIKAGVVTNKRKTLHPGKSVCCFALGTRELYDFVDDNPSVIVLDGGYVNDPAVIGLNDNQVSINTTLEVDLTGQCCSESIGPVQYSGTGGQTDTAVGAQRAKNGRSFIALYSTAQVNNKQTGESEEISKIVSTLKPGAIVSLSRNDVDYVVTEYGIAALRGTDVRERVRRLIAIAHPNFRERLVSEAKSLGYLARR